MLLNDRFVGTFGTVAPGDRELIVKVAVAAARNGFGVVPLTDEGEPACALGVRDAKKPHDCYHVLTVDTQVRAAFNRLTKDGATCNLGIDLAASNIGITTDVSWWNGPELSPTLIMPEGERLYVFDVSDADQRVIENLDGTFVMDGTLMVPPSCLPNDPAAMVRLIGQMNYLKDNNAEKEETVTPEETRELWENRPAETLALEARIDSLENQVAALKSALIVALTNIKELKEAR